MLSCLRTRDTWGKSLRASGWEQLCATGGAYDGRTVGERSGGFWRAAMAGDGSVTNRGRGILQLMVLAAATVARIPRGNRGRRTLAMAGGSSVGLGIRSCPALRLGFRVDGTRHAGTNCSAEKPGSRGFLSLCAEPNVCGLCRRVDRSVDRVRTPQPGGDCFPGDGCPPHTSVLGLLRRADVAQKIRGGLHRGLPERKALGAMPARLEPAAICAHDCLRWLSAVNS